MPIAHWEEVPEAWDLLTFAGVFWPGVAEVKVKKGWKLDRKDGPGANGETITYQGKKAADVEITIRVWTKAQWDELQAYIPLLDPPEGKKDPVPHDIVHPVTEFHRISSVAVEEIEGPEETGQKGVYQIKIKGVSFKLPTPKPATTTPKSSSSSGAPKNVGGTVGGSASGTHAATTGFAGTGTDPADEDNGP